ncbi:protease adaptor protein RcdA [Methylobacterium sp. JK268]
MVEMDVMFRDARDTVNFGETFVASEAFRSLFREGMTLVEETAAYLDGPGRDESRLLSRHAALTYASESMRLTTRLMQIASWLLVQRAVSEGELTLSEAQQEKTRVRLSAGETSPEMSPAAVAELPLSLQALIDHAKRLHARIRHLDSLISDDRPTPAPRESPVFAQQDMLRAAFRAAH